MEDETDEKKVADLLNKLKNSNGVYPAEMLAVRRQAYLRQVANVGLGIGIGKGLKHISKGGGNISGTMTTLTSKVLEMALIAAITIEAGTVAYLYRDKIANAVRSYLGSSPTHQVAPPATDISVSGFETMELTPSVTVSATPATPSGTPSPQVAGAGTSTNNNKSSSGGSNTTVNATPRPDGDNGNHYGVTPKPVRTKNTPNDGGGNNNNGGGHNNRP